MEWPIVKNWRVLRTVDYRWLELISGWELIRMHESWKVNAGYERPRESISQSIRKSRWELVIKVGNKSWLVLVVIRFITEPWETRKLSCKLVHVPVLCTSRQSVNGISTLLANAFRHRVCYSTKCWILPNRRLSYSFDICRALNHIFASWRKLTRNQTLLKLRWENFQHDLLLR